MLFSVKRSATGIIVRFKILDSSQTDGRGLTGLTSASSGLVISTIADNEASATAYTVAGSTIETITTLGTYAAPTATKCRFKEVDATNHKGIYELHLANARFAVASAKSLLVSVSGATNAAESDFLIPLVDLDPYDSVRAGLTALPNAAAGANGGLPTGDASGRVTVVSNADKTGYSLSSTGLNAVVPAEPAGEVQFGVSTLPEHIAVQSVPITNKKTFNKTTGVATYRNNADSGTLWTTTATDDGTIRTVGKAT